MPLLFEVTIDILVLLYGCLKSASGEKGKIILEVISSFAFIH